MLLRILSHIPFSDQNTSYSITIEKNMETCFQKYLGPSSFSFNDLCVTAGDDVETSWLIILTVTISVSSSEIIVK